ncbi:hypothetical protein ASE01_20155 [Nocardioides sp. Root190]|uniref:hypothetical protein n=1 Tax=Nocardioides sp. Root190 TaxID=1736488 RepID=UPI0006FA18A1|nr:hypothetical protein [Nocardioides sp. Root190]KRB73091.1 hypothetical protein ASE01_20155 [Nocardioides sp. Root190]
MKSSRAMIVLLSVIALGVVAIAAVLIATAVQDGDEPDARPEVFEPTDLPDVPTQAIAGNISIYTNTAFETIPNSEWNRCDGEPECDGSECYGVGDAEGLGSQAEVLITDSTGEAVALGQMDSTWGWKRGATGGACIMTWSAEVPVDETGVLNVQLAGEPAWTVLTTLAELAEAPGAAALYLGDLDS